VPNHPTKVFSNALWRAVRTRDRVIGLWRSSEVFRALVIGPLLWLCMLGFLIAVLVF
jgi:hypothetical protein